MDDARLDVGLKAVGVRVGAYRENGVADLDEQQLAGGVHGLGLVGVVVGVVMSLAVVVMRGVRDATRRVEHPILDAHRHRMQAREQPLDLLGIGAGQLERAIAEVWARDVSTPPISPAGSAAA